MGGDHVYTPVTDFGINEGELNEKIRECRRVENGLPIYGFRSEILKMLHSQQISANATKTAAELRRLLEQLMNGKTVNHGSLTPIVLQLLSSRDSIMLMKSVQQQMGTCILFDRQNLTIRIFGPVNQVALTEQKLVASLLALRDKQQTDIRL
ncbi:hypothetical protein NC653_003274 [Populus alba x Populus x berolinensis]|uniref:Uncharacterized protein n=1 Tax=Populus alba x Populus x berolinensis TaxID=444605 RepID=A0AAD6WI05_9ROSI|nr:hypothetical protein NC653_003274 [Populus alba x Populus x berolinensis]